LPALRAAGADEADIVADALLLATRVAADYGLYDGGYRVLTNDGLDAGQTVQHLHFHVLGGRSLQMRLG
jgi:histidine triad (HIT) family protein